MYHWIEYGRISVAVKMEGIKNETRKKDSGSIFCGAAVFVGGYTCNARSRRGIGADGGAYQGREKRTETA